MDSDSNLIGRNEPAVQLISNGCNLDEAVCAKIRHMKEPGLDKRHRDVDGEIERKKGNTRVDTLRETYGDDFLSDFRGDAHLETVLKETGAQSLTELVQKHRKQD